MRDEKEDGAGLIHPIASPVVGTEPRPIDACATCGGTYPGQRILTDGDVWWHTYCEKPMSAQAARTIERAMASGFIRNSFRHMVDDLRQTANRARRRFRKNGELQRIYGAELEAYATACDEAAEVFRRRMDALSDGNQTSDAVASVRNRGSEAP